MRRRIFLIMLLILSLWLLNGCGKEEKEPKGELVYLEMADRPALFCAWGEFFDAGAGLF